MRQGKVLYVDGNTLYVQLNDGTVREFDVPSDFMFNIDGRMVSVNQFAIVFGMLLAPASSAARAGSSMCVMFGVILAITGMSPAKALASLMSSGLRTKDSAKKSTPNPRAN